MSEEPVLTNTSPNFGIPPDKQNSVSQFFNFRKKNLSRVYVLF